MTMFPSVCCNLYAALSILILHKKKKHLIKNKLKKRFQKDQFSDAYRLM